MDTLTLSFQLKISKKRTDGKAPIYNMFFTSSKTIRPKY
jgi:hypothetical protein